MCCDSTEQVIDGGTWAEGDTVPALQGCQLAGTGSLRGAQTILKQPVGRMSATG